MAAPAPVRIDADGVIVDGRRSKAGRHRGRADETVRNDRRPHSLMKNRGRPKKGGAGGKYSWGRAGIDDLYEADYAIDEGDPNYEVEENEEKFVLVSRYDTESHKASRVGVPLSSGGGRMGLAAAGAGGAGASGGGVAVGSRINLSQFKKRIIPVIAEYFDSEDANEVARAVSDLHAAFFHYEVVKRAITMSMDRKDRERELVSRLISALYPKVMPMPQIAKAFERLFELADDLELDNPEAKKHIAQFLGRAVVDDVLPPSFLSDPLMEDMGGEIVHEARSLLSMRHGSARLERVWGPSAGETSDLKTAVRMLVQEYFLSNDAAEAGRCIRELNVPHFHHEVVKRAIVVAMDRDHATQTHASYLLKFLHNQGILSQHQIAIGFQRVKAELADIALDQPHAAELFEEFVANAKSSDCLAADWTGVVSEDTEAAGEAGAEAEATAEAEAAAEVAAVEAEAAEAAAES